LLWLVAAVVAAIAVFSLLVAEPSYEGRGLSAWLGDFPLTMDPAGNSALPFSSNEQAKIDRAAVAIRGMGARALPHLLRELRATDSALAYRYYTWKESLTKRRYNRYAFMRRSQAAFALGELGQTGSSVVPDLTRMCRDSSESHMVRHSAFLALEKIAPGSVQKADLQ
jgi:hypothetical protein